MSDVEDMSNNAIKILSNPETLNQFKQNSVTQARTFDIQQIVPKDEAIYQDTLNKCKVY